MKAAVIQAAHPLTIGLLAETEADLDAVAQIAAHASGVVREINLRPSDTELGRSAHGRRQLAPEERLLVGVHIAVTPSHPITPQALASQ